MRFQALRQVFQPLDCSGSPYERGRIQGETYQRQIQLCFNALFQSELFRLLQRTRWPESWGRRLTLWQARRRLRPILRRHLPQVWEQLQGLAVGSGLGLDPFLFLTQLELMLSHKYVLFGSGSNLVIPARFSALEEPLLIRNFDLPYFLKAFTLFRQTSVEDGLRSLELSLLPSLGAQAGMNEAGVALAYNYAYGPQSSRYPLPVSLQVQQALQRCETAAEVVRFFELGQQQGGAILTVMDKRSEIYLIELSSANVYSKEVRDNLLIATNHYQMTALGAEDIPVKAYFPFRHGLKEIAGRRVRESSESRLDRLYELTGTSILFHPNDLQSYFQDHGEAGRGDDNSLCRHGDYYETANSVLLRPLAREVRVAMGCPCEYPYQAYQWL